MRVADRAVIEVREESGLMEGIRQRVEGIVRTASFQATAWLLAILIANSILGAGGAGRLLYVLPAWIVAERYGREVGVLTVAAGVLLHAIFGRGLESTPIVGALLQLTIGIGLVLRVDRHLRHARKFQHLAGHDPLTGVANRKTLEAYAERELNRCVAEGCPYTVAVIDCDKFKALNDVYGHAYGDEVLKLLTANVEKAIGKRGKLGRTGGDEFVVILPGMSYLEAESRLSGAAQSFADSTLVRGGKASFSVGLAECPTDGVFLTRLMEAADDDMYRRKAAKKAGAIFEISA